MFKMFGQKVLSVIFGP